MKSPKVSYEEKIKEAETLLKLNFIFQMRFGDGVGLNPQAKLALKDISLLFKNSIQAVRKDTLEEAIGIVGKDEDWVNRPYVDKKNDYIAYAKNQLRQELRKKLLSLISSMKGGKE